eukprot:sb/3471266/
MPRYAQTQTFFHKRVVKLECKHCMNILCWRGMRAILLADTSIELYSTDLPPPNAVEMSGDDYCTSNCDCHIRDLVCAGCGNQVGYHVTLPCRNCMESCNNGHFWMFHAPECKESERMDDSVNQDSIWDVVRRVVRKYVLLCRVVRRELPIVIFVYCFPPDLCKAPEFVHIFLTSFQSSVMGLVWSES